MAGRNISVRMSDEQIQRVDSLGEALGRSRAWVLNEATQRFLDYEEWFATQINAGVADARAGRVTAHREVRATWQEKRARLLD